MYDQIWRDIKAAKHEPTTRELLDIVQALRGKFNDSDGSAAVEALSDCCIYLSDCADFRESEAADWMADDAACRRGNAAGSIPAFISNAI